jgi:putative DNA-invertase from lambdoid prophage Rac
MSGHKLKFSAIPDLMPKTSAKPTISMAPRKRVFGQGEKAPRAGLYARVSTHDQQTLPMQLAAMRDYVRRRGWNIAVEVKDVGSGAALRQKREELLAAARRRAIDLVVVWRLDRWGRSLVDLVNTLQELSSLKLRFVERSS